MSTSIINITCTVRLARGARAHGPELVGAARLRGLQRARVEQADLKIMIMIMIILINIIIIIISSSSSSSSSST